MEELFASLDNIQKHGTNTNNARRYVREYFTTGKSDGVRPNGSFKEPCVYVPTPNGPLCILL